MMLLACLLLVFLCFLGLYARDKYKKRDRNVDTLDDERFLQSVAHVFSQLYFKHNVEKEKNEIRKLFLSKVKGKIPDIIQEGHWLEKQFGLLPNGNNHADIKGFELKKDASKITFGDWGADEYIFKPHYILPYVNRHVPKKFGRDDFLRIFGRNEKKEHRYSWSGLCIPKYNTINEYGQGCLVDPDNNIYIIYSHLFDTNAHNKPKWVSQQDFFILAYWRGLRLENLLKSKFDQRGFVLCCKNKQNVYDRILFGKNIDFDTWMSAFKKGHIFLDSGMYEGNRRNYSLWRAHKSFWHDLLEED